jgi:Carboxypeptidase C (cathepsin A)
MKDPSGYVIGTYQNYKQFTFAIVNKAGHSVPQGQPWSAKYVIDLFIKNKWGQE